MTCRARPIPAQLGLLFVLSCSSAPASKSEATGPDPTAAGSAGEDGGDGTSGDGSGGDGSDSGLTEWTADCTETDEFGPVFEATRAVWDAQDAAVPWPAGGLVFVGSSSIRRWRSMSRDYADQEIIQRGFGGAQLAEVAQHTEALITRHHPAGVVIYAGTNDVAAGVAPDVVADRLRCMHARLRTTLGPTVPVLFIGVTPSPARWDSHDQAEALNAEAAALATDDPAFVYVDVSTPFLATGSPPDAALFVGDGLHLSADGYALWNSVIRAAVDRMLPTSTASHTAPGLVAGERVLVDLGASDATNGEHSASPDHLGQHWNNWHGLSGGAEILPGERLANLLTSEGSPTGLDLVITGGFFNNGREHGGLRWPDSDRLGTLAVGTATEDFFYTDGEDHTGGLVLRGLDPSAHHELRLFASRASEEVRVTGYTVQGADRWSQSLQTSGPGAGTSIENDDTVIVFDDVQADAWGRIFVELDTEAGPYGYLSLLELSVWVP